MGLQVDQLLQRMRDNKVRFNEQAVARLTGFCFSRNQPQLAFQLFKVGGCVWWGRGCLRGGLCGSSLALLFVSSAVCVSVWRVPDGVLCARVWFSRGRAEGAHSMVLEQHQRRGLLPEWSSIDCPAPLTGADHAMLCSSLGLAPNG